MSECPVEIPASLNQRVAAAGVDLGLALRQIDERLASAIGDPALAAELGGFVALHIFRSEMACLQAWRRLEDLPETITPALESIFLQGLVLANAGGFRT